MARDYENQINHSPITGFPSAAAEYAEMRLSLDQKFNTFNPSMKLVTLKNDSYDFKKGDILQVDLSRKPRKGDYILTEYTGEMRVFRLGLTNQNLNYLENSSSAVVVAVHRAITSTRNSRKS